MAGNVVYWSREVPMFGVVRGGPGGLPGAAGGVGGSGGRQREGMAHG